MENLKPKYIHVDCIQESSSNIFLDIALDLY